ncbi:MAG: response regulator [Candidatus Viridilinea halotolerans]|uniref:Response regulator n=1 Tax=Candidatus Viridilinea halotolerans TaxID=2491704 RepID=A0A426TXA0_9CHLR|nr:MAG: response regulator [Candidatus Viridilinea halotolerans]
MRPIPVLFIDPSPPFRHLIVRLLERYFAADITFVAEVDHWPPAVLPTPPPQAVLLGLGGAGLTDPRLIRSIHTLLPAVPVVVLGHLEEPAYRQAALAAGAAGFVAKEAISSELIPLLRQLVTSI